MLSYSKSNLHLLCQEANTDHHCSFHINQGLRYFEPKLIFMLLQKLAYLLITVIYRLANLVQSKA